MTPRCPLLWPLGVLAGAFSIGCAVSPDEAGLTSSAAAQDTARVITVSLDAPPSWLVDHSQSVTFAVTYPDGPTAAELFPRSDLAQGIGSKPFNLRPEATINDCTFTWTVVERPIGASVGSTRALLEPRGFDGRYAGTCTVGETGATLRLPWAMSTLAIELSTGALDAHGAKGVIGQVSVEGASAKFSMGYATAASTWSVDVLAPAGAKRTAALTWLLRAGGTTQTSVETTGDHLAID